MIISLKEILFEDKTISYFLISLVIFLSFYSVHIFVTTWNISKSDGKSFVYIILVSIFFLWRKNLKTLTRENYFDRF